MTPSPRAAYVHVPFCRHRCGYCNFTLIAGRDGLIPDYLRALERELAALGEPRPVDTLFLGGGTPTHLPANDLARLLELVGHWFPLASGGEFSVEANPIDIDPPRVERLRAAGVTRVSLGAQSFDSAKLAQLERDHTPEQIGAAVEQLRPAISQVSLDLIFGVPDETEQVWQADLDRALALNPTHVSTYGLTWERGTSFWSRRQRGELTPLGEELEGRFYERGIDTLTGVGFEHYEVSNFALPGGRCRHNERYWAGDEYFAAGPGAARYVNGRRSMNHRSTTTWLKRVLAGESPIAEWEELGPEERAREALVFGLRRMAGVERQAFAARFGFELDPLAGPALGKFIHLGLLVDDGQRIRLSRRGLLVSDALWPELLAP